MGRVSMATMIQRHKGFPMRCRVDQEVAHALLDEARLCQTSTANVMAQLLRYWYEDVYIPNRQAISGVGCKKSRT